MFDMKVYRKISCLIIYFARTFEKMKNVVVRESEVTYKWSCMERYITEIEWN